MIRLVLFGLLITGALYFSASGLGVLSDLKNGNAALLMSGITASELNTRILQHYKETVLNGVNEFTADSIDTTITDLNDDGDKDVIAIVESGMTCGTGGCIASIFIKNDLGELTAIPFAYAVKRIEVLESLTRGMHDLRVNNDETYRMVWDGTTYAPEQI